MIFYLQGAEYIYILNIYFKVHMQRYSVFHVY